MSDMMTYDEDLAISFIRKDVGSEVSSQYSDDEILYVIDIIWDYYEKKGLLSLSKKATDNQELDEDGLLAYVRKEIASDGEILMDPEDLDKIVKAELDYEDTLEDA